MEPNSDLEVTLSRSTMLAGRTYSELTFECTKAGNSTETPSTAAADKANFEFQITLQIL